MKFSTVVFLLVIYLESYLQCFAQVQSLGLDLTSQEPGGNPAEFPKNTWIHYDQGTFDPWHYYNFSTQEWFEWE